MTNDQVLELLPLIEVQVCGILIENNLCEYIQKPKSNSNKKQHNRFKNLKFTKAVIIENLISDQDIHDLRGLYPKGSDRKGNFQTIKDKAICWLTENREYTFKDIFQVVQRYVFEEMNKNGGEMLFNLNNIFFKVESNKFTISPMSVLFEKYKPKEAVVQDIKFDI